MGIESRALGHQTRHCIYCTNALRALTGKIVEFLKILCTNVEHLLAYCVKFYLDILNAETGRVLKFTLVGPYC